MKKKNNSEQARRNRNNRNRGGSFEKKVADILDMDVVPYSGSNARFGYGDVRDTIWLCECKNITPSDNKITLKIDWFIKNRERAFNIKHKPFLAWMPSGKADKYIIIENDIMEDCFGSHNGEQINLPVKHNTKNLIIDISDDYFKKIRKGSVVKILLYDEIFHMMDINTFIKLRDNNNLKGDRQQDGV